MQDNSCQRPSYMQLYQNSSKHWRQLLEHQHFQEAIFNIQSYIEACPELQIDFFGIGNREEKEGVCFELQISWYYSEITKHQKINNPHDLLSWAVSCLNNCEQAISWYHKMLKMYPTCYKLHHGLANAYYNTHRYSQSQLHYKQVIRINPKLVRGYICLAWIALSHYQEVDLAFRYASNALALDQQDFYARLIVGQFHQEDRKSKEMIKALEKQFKGHPLVICAKAYLIYSSEPNEQKRNEAMELIAQAMSIDEDVTQIYIRMAAFSSLSGKQSEEQARQLLKAKSRSRKHQRYILYCKLAESYYYSSQYVEAFQYFNKSLQINQKDNVSLYFMGCIYYDVFLPRRFQMAIECLKKSIEINPRQSRSYQKLRKIYCEDDGKVQALFAQELSFKVKQNEDIKILLVQMLKQSNYQSQVQQFIYQQVKKHVEAESLSQFLAQKYFSAKLWESSLRQILFCLKLNPYNVASLQKMIKLYQSGWKRQEIQRYIIDYLNDLKNPIVTKDVCSCIATIFRLAMDEQVLESLLRIGRAGKQLEFKLILADYYKKNGNFESQIKIYQEIRQNERFLDFSDDKERDNYFGRNSKWLKMKSLGLYSKRQQIELFLTKGLFEKRFKELLKQGLI